MQLPARLFLDGEYRDSANGRRTSLINPATEEAFTEVAAADIAAIGIAEHVEIMVAAVLVATAVMFFLVNPISTFIERHRIVKVAPQSLKKTLGCATDQKWRDRAGELFNPDGKRPNWSKGAAGAVAVAFKVAGE